MSLARSVLTSAVRPVGHAFRSSPTNISTLPSTVLRSRFSCFSTLSPNSNFKRPLSTQINNSFSASLVKARFEAGPFSPLFRQFSSSVKRSSTGQIQLQAERPILVQTEGSQSSSSSSSSSSSRANISTPIVAKWLYFTSFLTLSIVVVGGLTRLTESGLSITEWKPFKGSLPPLNQADWEEEFRKYQLSEEGMILNAQISLNEFKFIFFMEWAHRNLGRFLGVTFVLPALFFAARGKLVRKDQLKVFAMALGIGFQGFLGWYMVSSGLDKEHLAARPNSTPRVSQYRLAAHLGTAFVLYLGMLHTGLSIARDWKLAHGGPVGGEKDGLSVQKMLLDGGKKLTRFRGLVWVVGAMVLFTALSGAFVAGLDAGLIYNEWPQMGEGYIPPMEDMIDPRYARREDGKDLIWRNVLENPTTVQFDHRMLAYATATSVFTLTGLSHSPLLRSVLNRRVRLFASLASGVVLAQVTLGITTLLYLVPIPVAAAHQAGSVFLLSAMTALAVALRRPSKAVKEVWAKRALVEKALKK